MFKQAGFNGSCELGQEFIGQIALILSEDREQLKFLSGYCVSQGA